MGSAAQFLRETRLRMGMTQAELAERCGITQSVISAYESGRREPSVPALQRLVAGTGLRLELDARSPHELPRRGHGELLRRKRKAVRVALAKHNVSEARVFGSVARGEQTPTSDIDIAVRMPADTDLIDIAALGLDLESILGVPVDVVPFSSLRPGVAAEVERDGIAL